MLLIQDSIEWLRDPKVLSNHPLGTYEVWMVASVALIVFIESGVLFPVLPGDSMFSAIGLLQNRMPMSLIAVCLVVITAAIYGGQMGYWLGLFFGEKLLRGDAKILKTEYLKFSKVFFPKRGGSAVVLGRFISPIRAFVPIAAGTGRYHWSHFILWNVAGAIAWALTSVVAGALLGGIPLVHGNVEVITIIIIVFSALPAAVGLMRKHLDTRWCTTRPHSAA